MQLVDRRPVFPAAVARARLALTEHLADGHQVVAVGLEHRDELVHQVDRRRIDVVQQHHRVRFDLRHQHVAGGRRVRVVGPVERDDVPVDVCQALLFGLREHVVVDQTPRGAHQVRPLTGRRLDCVAGLGELGRRCPPAGSSSCSGVPRCGCRSPCPPRRCAGHRRGWRRPCCRSGRTSPWRRCPAGFSAAGRCTGRVRRRMSGRRT